MLRHYYISDDLDDLEILEHELEDENITTPQIHVLSDDDTGVETHHLHEVKSLFKTDIVHATEVGALIGIAVSTTVLLVAAYSGVTESVGWLPFVFLAVVLLGFCTWEGGLFGIQKLNVQFERFRSALRSGKHIFFVDLEPEQEATLAQAIKHHPRLELAGTGPSSPHWFIQWQNNWQRFIKFMP